MIVWQCLGLPAFISSEALIFHECTPSDWRRIACLFPFWSQNFITVMVDAVPEWSSVKWRAVRLICASGIVLSVCMSDAWDLAGRERGDRWAFWEERLRPWVSWFMQWNFGEVYGLLFICLRNDDSSLQTFLCHSLYWLVGKLSGFVAQFLLQWPKGVLPLGLWSVFADELECLLGLWRQ